MSKNKQFSNAFSRVLSKSKDEEKEQSKQGVDQSTSKQVNQKDLYEVNKNELNKLQEGEKLASQSVKKLTKNVKEPRSVKGFKLTKKTQKIIGLMAQLHGKKEYEIIEQGVDLLLEANPEMKKLLKLI